MADVIREFGESARLYVASNSYVSAASAPLIAARTRNSLIAKKKEPPVAFSSQAGQIRISVRSSLIITV